MALASAATLVSYLLNGFGMQACLKALGTRISLVEATRLQIAGYTLNLLPLKGGTLLIGAEMRRSHAVSWGKYAALTAGSQVVSLATFSFIAGVCVLLSGTNLPLGLALTVMPVFAAVVGWHWARATALDLRRDPSGPVSTAVRRVHTGLHALANDRRAVAGLLMVNAAVMAIHGARLWLLFRALDTPVTALTALAAISLGSVAYLVSVVPGGFGFRESGIVAGCLAMGVSASAGFAAAIADRAIDLMWILLLGVPIALTLTRRSRAEST